MFADVATRAYDPAQRKPADGATAADLGEPDAEAGGARS